MEIADIFVVNKCDRPEADRFVKFLHSMLAPVFSRSKEDWVNARKIINGLDKAQLIASYAKKYYGAISYTT